MIIGSAWLLLVLSAFGLLYFGYLVLSGVLIIIGVVLFIFAENILYWLRGVRKKTWQNDDHGV